MKDTSLENLRHRFDNFDIVPEEGCRLHSFVDYASKLLVVTEFPVDNLTNKAPGQFIIDPQTGSILGFEAYKQYFNYNLQVSYSEDGKYRYEYQRKHDFEKGTDFEEERLIDVEQGAIFSACTRVGFHEKKPQTLLEIRHEGLERLRKYSEKEAAKLTLDEHYAFYHAALKDNQIILSFSNQEQLYQLVFEGNMFVMHTKKHQSGAHVNFEKTTKYTSLEAFWTDFTTNPYWYLNFRPMAFPEPEKQERVIAKFIIEEANKIRKSGNFSQQSYDKLHNWENLIHTASIKRSEYQMFCSNCGDSLGYNPRYPKAICRNCFKLLTDENGRKVIFYNTDLMGGCQGYYIDKEPHEAYNSDACFIGDSAFVAKEAYFGGIVVQKKEPGD